jgi:hypothetical protein
MSSKSRYLLSRRKALASLAAVAAHIAVRGNSATAEPIHNSGVPENGAGPVFSATGPDADLYGAADGFPVPGFLRAVLQGNPYKPEYRVGAFSHFDEIYTTRRIKRAAVPWTFKRSPTDIRYSYRGKPSSLTEYLARNPVTGHLIAKDDRILFEHYQYGRTDRDRLLSQSMVKSITGILIGIAVSEGAIKSVDDKPETYVPGFKGTEYGRLTRRPLADVCGCSSSASAAASSSGLARNVSHTDPESRPHRLQARAEYKSGDCANRLQVLNLDVCCWHQTEMPGPADDVCS